MNKEELEERTRRFAVDVIRFANTFPRNPAADVIGRQLIRSSCSVGSNYREANRAESQADFIHKLGVVQKEAAESEYWLQISCETELGSIAVGFSLAQEANELLRIFGSSRRTSKQRQIANRKSQIANRKSQIVNRKS
jgi:four helix bundle protein